MILLFIIISLVHFDNFLKKKEINLSINLNLFANIVCFKRFKHNVLTIIVSDFYI